MLYQTSSESRVHRLMAWLPRRRLSPLFLLGILLLALSAAPRSAEAAASSDAADTATSLSALEVGGTATAVPSRYRSRASRHAYGGLPGKYHATYRWGVANLIIAGTFGTTGLLLLAPAPRPGLYGDPFRIIPAIPTLIASGVASLLAGICGIVVEGHRERREARPQSAASEPRPEFNVGPEGLTLQF